MDFIKELYLENTSLAQSMFNKNSKYAKLMNKIDLIITDLKKTLPEEYMNQVESLCDINSELLSISSQENYVSGFRDGAKIIIDIFTGKNDNLHK